MTQEIIHALVLIFAIVLTFIFPKTGLINYDLQIIAGLFLILYIVKRFILKESSLERLFESVIFTLVIMGVINSTGGISSPFFFLVYFLLFSLSLLLEPVIAVTTTLTLVIIFLLEITPNQDIKTYLPIISLAFITPFAMYLSSQQKKNEKLKIKNQTLTQDTYLFLSLLLKNHVKNILEAIENFSGDHELTIIRKSAQRMEKLIEKFEKD